MKDEESDKQVGPETTAKKELPNQPPCPGALLGLPYILHTTDEIASVPSDPNIPTHVIGMRVFDTSVLLSTGIVPSYQDSHGRLFSPYGGGKIGIYNQWAAQSTQPPSSGGAVEYEFYNYTANGLAETGNNYASDPLGAQYVAAFQAICQAELYYLLGPGFPGSAHSTALSDYFAGQSCSGASPQQQVIDMES